MAPYKEMFDAMAPWRKAATVALTVLALVVLVAIVAGAVTSGVGVGLALAVVVASYLVGPRSPLFGRTGPS